MKWTWKIVRLLAAVCVLGTLPSPSQGGTTLGSICRVKGQEETTLHGLGIVTGLKGTGDGANALPTIRSLAATMQLLGNPLGPGGMDELKEAKNVALVMVTATVPAAGARRGDKLDCAVSAISAKSLAGGRLFLTPLIGPLPQPNPPVYALAQGPITLDNEDLTTTGRIHAGCRLVEDFLNPFSEDGKVTLLVDKDYADFRVAQEIADLINDRMALQSGGILVAKPLDPLHIEVTVPSVYRDALVDFVSQILNIEMVELEVGPRVTIRERCGIIVIDGDVEIGPVLVTHKNIVVETGGGPVGNRFVAVDSESPKNPKLGALLAALDAIHVPPEDVIEIIKEIHRSGNLYAELIIK